MNYQKKYLKYKQKYLELKGGMDSPVGLENIIPYIIPYLDSLEKIVKFTSTNKALRELKTDNSTIFYIKTLEIDRPEYLDILGTFSDHKINVNEIIISINITDNDLQYILSKIVFDGLQSINLERCYRITDNGLGHLSRLINLKTLYLDNCDHITDNGLVHLRGLTNLKMLRLESSDLITDNGLGHLSQLENLKELILHGFTQITIDGLAQLIRLPNLKILDIAYCDQITKDEIDQLNKPEGLRIEYFGDDDD
jgi:predicted transcriptional regulator